MRIEINHSCNNFESYRAARVKSLFNAESGHTWSHTAVLPIDEEDWQIGVIVGPSGSGKSSIGSRIFNTGITDISEGWGDGPIIDEIAPQGEFNQVTGALAAVGLGDVPSWLRPYAVLSNGEKFRAGLARLICEAPDTAVIDEFTSVVDRQIAKIGALAFAKAWRRLGKNKVVLLTPHYDVLEWLQPDWTYDTSSARFSRDCLRRPKIELEIHKTNGKLWKYFKPHYYLDLPHPPCAEYFVGTVDGELVAHVAVAPLFTAKAYRATRLVVMPEWQGAGVGTKFLEMVCQYHADGNGRKGFKFPTFFHTSHPQLSSYLRRAGKWQQTSASLYGANKTRSINSLIKTGNTEMTSKGNMGYGGHFRAVQGFKYISKPRPLKIMIAGQKHLGKEVLTDAINQGYEIVGVYPAGGDTGIKDLAIKHSIPIVNSLKDCKTSFDLGVCAHCFEYIPNELIQKSTHGFIGYHPSLLPQHKGRNSVFDTLRAKDFNVGGTVYWLSDKWDAGDIADQKKVSIDEQYYSLPESEAASRLWRSTLQPLGVNMLSNTIKAVSQGSIQRRPQ